MAYAKSLTIPANTAEADAVSADLPIAACIVKKVDIIIPTGHAGLAHLWVDYQARQLWPYNTGENFEGNGTVISFFPNLKFKDKVSTLKLVGYNEDDTFPHTFYVIVDVDFLGGFWDSFFGQIQESIRSTFLPGR